MTYNLPVTSTSTTYYLPNSGLTFFKCIVEQDLPYRCKDLVSTKYCNGYISQ